MEDEYGIDDVTTMIDRANITDGWDEFELGDVLNDMEVEIETIS